MKAWFSVAATMGLVWTTSSFLPEPSAPPLIDLGARPPVAQDPFDPAGRSFTFCRVAYRQVRRERNGQGWRTDYPDADRNLMLRLSQLTTTPIRRTAHSEPDHIIIQLSDDELFECPFIFMSDVGTMALDDLEAERLREYLLMGGFLWVDDFWGNRAWSAWVQEIEKALPAGDYPIIDIPSSHLILSALYNVHEVPQIPSIQYWRRSGRSGTSERGYESAVPHLRGIEDEEGRVIVVMTHNTDIADGWEREGEDEDFFFEFSPKAYALGINIVLYALTH